jgi:phage recombination protein Bet
VTTSTEIDVRQTAALAIRPGQEFWTEKQRSALTVLGIRNASNADLAVFFHYCQKTGLDPFSKQIYGIMRREKAGDSWVDKFTIQVGISGFQVIRDRIANRLGVTVEYEDTVWYDADGSEHTVWLWDTPPAAAKVVVLKDGKRYSGVCRTAAYMQTNRQGDPAGQWKTQPENMIEKCAEAKALRRAFPHDLGGLYIEEEMSSNDSVVLVQQAPARLTAADITGTVVTEPQNGNDHVPPPPEPTAAPAAEQATLDATPAAERTLSTEPGSSTSDQQKRIWAAFTDLGYKRDDRAEARAACETLAGRKFAKPVMENLSEAEADVIAPQIERLADRAALVALLAETSGGKP